jgi:hypothetical protein
MRTDIIRTGLAAAVVLAAVAPAAAQTVPSGGERPVFRYYRSAGGSLEYGVPGLRFAPASRLFSNRNYFNDSTAAFIGVRARVYSLREMDEEIVRQAERNGNAAPPVIPGNSVPPASTSGSLDWIYPKRPR